MSTTRLPLFDPRLHVVADVRLLLRALLLLSTRTRAGGRFPWFTLVNRGVFFPISADPLFLFLVTSDSMGCTPSVSDHKYSVHQVRVGGRRPSAGDDEPEAIPKLANPSVPTPPNPYPASSVLIQAVTSQGKPINPRSIAQWPLHNKALPAGSHTSSKVAPQPPAPVPSPPAASTSRRPDSEPHQHITPTLSPMSQSSLSLTASEQQSAPVMGVSPSASAAQSNRGSATATATVIGSGRMTAADSLQSRSSAPLVQGIGAASARASAPATSTSAGALPPLHPSANGALAPGAATERKRRSTSASPHHPAATATVLPLPALALPTPASASASASAPSAPASAATSGTSVSPRPAPGPNPRHSHSASPRTHVISPTAVAAATAREPLLSARNRSPRLSAVSNEKTVCRRGQGGASMQSRVSF